MTSHHFSAIVGKFAGSLYHFKTKIVLDHDGNCSWFAPTNIKSGCDINILWFPFDVQNCLLTFGSWSYHGLDLDIHPEAPEADLKFYMESNEFELIKAPVTRHVNYFT